MSKSPSKNETTGYPEYAVRAETICGYFHPPLARSTFHDFVNKGKIIPMKGIRGFYLLNASLKRLGLREVPSLPVEIPNLSMEDILRLAFYLIDPLVFPAPPWLHVAEELDMKDLNHAHLHAGNHREIVDSLKLAEEKINYFNGVLSAQTMLEAETRPKDG
jgi:hypothetical protein